MSTYKKITKNPATGLYENATWHDDHFGQHMYGVEFADGKIYPPDYLLAEIKHYWSDDVIKAFTEYLHTYHAPASQEDVTRFLNFVQGAYRQRWEEDPLTGGGAYMPSASAML